MANANGKAAAKPNAYGAGFTQLSPSVFYRIPSKNVEPAKKSKIKEPDLILLAAWMNASPRHVAKYTAAYQKVFPTSPVLVIKTETAHFLWQSDEQRIQGFEPALDILRNLQPQEQVLLHAFSNGGAAASWQLAQAYQARMGQTLPTSKVVLDSTPGIQGYDTAVTAMKLGLPKNPILQILGILFLRVFIGAWFLYSWALSRESIVDQMRRGVNDPSLFSTRAKRLYIYSMADELILWQDVEAHAKEAEGKGYNLQMVKYIDSKHTAHMQRDEKRYWEAVVGLWNSK